MEKLKDRFYTLLYVNWTLSGLFIVTELIFLFTLMKIRSLLSQQGAKRHEYASVLKVFVCILVLTIEVLRVVQQTLHTYKLVSTDITAKDYYEKSLTLAQLYIADEVLLCVAYLLTSWYILRLLTPSLFNGHV